MICLRHVVPESGDGSAPKMQAGQQLERDEVWSYDFISDVTTDGISPRILSAIDEKSRECLLLPTVRIRNGSLG